MMDAVSNFNMMHSE